MSFILDALRKIESEKVRGPGSQSSELGMGATDRLAKRRQAILMGAIALASAAVTAVVLSLFMSGGESGGESGSAEAISEAESRSELPVPAARAGLADEDNELTLLPPLVKPEPEPEREKERKPRREPEPRPPPEPEPSVPVAPAPTPPVGESPGAEDPPVQLEDTELAPFRVVGRERAAMGRYAPPIETGEVEVPEEGLDGAAPLPELVLQGTSVIDGNAVAVISDQRVFEGDLIKGARVVRIGDREVELELEGRRFVLRL